jgi:hypothetical protein
MVGIQGQDNQAQLRQISQQFANEALQQRAPGVGQQQGQEQGLLQLTDARQYSDELLEEISGKDESTKTSHLKTLVTSLKEMTDASVGDLMRDRQDASGAGAGTSQANKGQGENGEKGMALLDSLLERAFGRGKDHAGAEENKPQ